MPKAIDIQAALAPLRVLHHRRPDMQGADTDGVFATLAETNLGGVFAGSFDGESAWERHRNGDELVQILAGETRLTIMAEDGPVELEMKAGMLTVVPQGCWHKFRSETGVTVLTMTPQPTDHSTADPPVSGTAGV